MKMKSTPEFENSDVMRKVMAGENNHIDTSGKKKTKITTKTFGNRRKYIVMFFMRTHYILFLA